MKPFRLSAPAIALLLAACTATPTDPASANSDAGPGMLGSGNYSSAAGGNMLGAGGNSVEESGDGSATTEDGALGSGSATSDSTGTETGRGGNGLGSGN